MHAHTTARATALRMLLLLTLLAWLPAALAQGEWDDASGVLSITGQSPRYFDRINRSFFSEVTVQNTSGRELVGLFRLVIPASSIDVKDPSGPTGTGEPFMSVE